MAKLNEEFILDPKKQSSSKKNHEYFTVLGDHEFLDDLGRPRMDAENNKVLAKTSTTDNYPTRYYVKAGTYGKLFNPIGLYSEGRQTKFLSKIGRKEYEFKEVNQRVFDYYVQFLTTKNLAWLNNAERELV